MTRQQCCYKGDKPLRESVWKYRLDGLFQAQWRKCWLLKSYFRLSMRPEGHHLAISVEGGVLFCKWGSDVFCNLRKVRSNSNNGTNIYLAFVISILYFLPAVTTLSAFKNAPWTVWISTGVGHKLWFHRALPQEEMGTLLKQEAGGWAAFLRACLQREPYGELLRPCCGYGDAGHG